MVCRASTFRFIATPSSQSRTTTSARTSDAAFRILRSSFPGTYSNARRRAGAPDVVVSAPPAKRSEISYFSHP